MVGNLNDMTFPEKFDYVVVNGVLEYAMSFTEGKTPYETFLQRMGAYLKPEGRLLIAIENRLGLKYFAGAPEDHTDLHFFGINGYPGNQSVRTFSKNELGRAAGKQRLSFSALLLPVPGLQISYRNFLQMRAFIPIPMEETIRCTQIRQRIFFSEHAGVKAFEKEKILSSFCEFFPCGGRKNRKTGEGKKFSM